MAVEVQLDMPSAPIDPVSRESWPIGCQLGANWVPIGCHFGEPTMEIIPVAITLHRQHAGEHSHVQSYTTHQDLYYCNGEFSLKKFIERDNAS